MPIQWAHESADLRDDPVSGARIRQLTSAAAISHNIYGEQPYTSPDGKRIIIARCQDFCWDTEGSLLVHELDTLRTTMVVRRALGVRTVCTSAWSGLMHYWTQDRKLMRLSLMTLEQQEVYAEDDPAAPLPSGGGGSSSRVNGVFSTLSESPRVSEKPIASRTSALMLSSSAAERASCVSLPSASTAWR